MAKRRKHNCWKRKRHFIELLFEEYGSDEYREDRPPAGTAVSLAGSSSYRAGQSIIRRYLSNGNSFRQPDEPTHQSRCLYGKLDFYKDVLLGKLSEWKYDTLEQRANKINRERWPLRDKAGNIKRGPTGRRVIAKITASALAKWYKRNGITCVRPKYHISNAWTDAERLRKQ